MVNRTFQLGDRQLDLDLWTKLYYKHQKEYQRQRLWAIKYLYEGQTRVEVMKLLNCTYKTLSTWIDKFLQGGLDELVKPISHQVESRLSLEQKSELKIKLETYFQNSQLQTPEQIQNTIRHICALVR